MIFFDFQHRHGVTRLPLWFPPPASVELREVEASDGRGNYAFFSIVKSKLNAIGGQPRSRRWKVGVRTKPTLTLYGELNAQAANGIDPNSRLSARVDLQPASRHFDERRSVRAFWPRHPDAWRQRRAVRSDPLRRCTRVADRVILVVDRN